MKPRDAARLAFERGPVGYAPLVVPGLAEAAARAGDVTLLTATLDWLSERTRATPNEWARGIEARVRALLSEGDAAEGYYRESIELLTQTSVRTQLARAHLLYGEWLRRERRSSPSSASAPASSSRWRCLPTRTPPRRISTRKPAALTLDRARGGSSWPAR
jgi:hypothetical protein